MDEKGTKSLSPVTVQLGTGKYFVALIDVVFCTLDKGSIIFIKLYTKH
jgi:hypothetical protein